MPQRMNRWNVAEQCRVANENNPKKQEMPQGINRWNVAEQCEVANENDPGTQGMPQGINNWNVSKQLIEAKDNYQRMHRACDSVAGEIILCATVTRKAGDIIGACDNALATEMTRDDRKNRIPSGDDASVNNGV